MALKGSDISATYQDWVHVNKAGAGLADHAGAEAALYLDDGAGGVDQICGRTAVRHWLDPDPDTIAGTWEFSTYGDANQAALESAGWTFTNCTGAVDRGLLVLTSTGSEDIRADITVSLTGDYDFVFKLMTPSITTVAAQYDYIAGFMVGIPEGVGHNIVMVQNGGEFIPGATVNDAYDTAPNSGTTTNVIINSNGLMRLARYSGTAYAVACFSSDYAAHVGNACYTNGYWVGQSGAESDTLTKLCFFGDAATSGHKYAVPFIRRYK